MEIRKPPGFAVYAMVEAAKEPKLIPGSANVEEGKSVPIGDDYWYVWRINGQKAAVYTLQFAPNSIIQREASFIIEADGKRRLEGKITLQSRKIGISERTIFFGDSVEEKLRTEYNRKKRAPGIRRALQALDIDVADFEAIVTNPHRNLDRIKALLARFPHNPPLEE